MRIVNLILLPGLALLSGPILLLSSIRLQAQGVDPIFNANAVLAVENSLASDSMRGRAVFTPDIERAADYHTPEDEIGNLDLQNMANIIKAIAISSGTIVAGRDTPSRVNAEQLR